MFTQSRPNTNCLPCQGQTPTVPPVRAGFNLTNLKIEIFFKKVSSVGCWLLIRTFTISLLIFIQLYASFSKTWYSQIMKYCPKVSLFTIFNCWKYPIMQDYRSLDKNLQTEIKTSYYNWPRFLTVEYKPSTLASHELHLSMYLSHTKNWIIYYILFV